MPIEHISDTARWVAFYRAMESERPDAIFRDPFARKLAGTRGEEIVNTMPRGRAMAAPMIVRTAVLDEVILQAVAESADMVVNLAAGLDARPFRLDLPPELRWVDVDFPAILDYKAEILGDAKPRCRYEAATVDLTDVAARQALFARLGAESKRAIVVSEGLLVYLTPEQVGTLATDLRRQESFRWWLFDLASPRLLVYMQKMWGKNVAQGNAPFRFAPAEHSAFFAPFGWRERDFRSGMLEARRLHRELRGMWFWMLIGHLMPKAKQEEFRRMNGYVLLEAAPAK